MLTAKPKGVLSKRFRLQDGDATVGELHMSHMKEKAEAVVNERRLNLYREGLFRGPFILESEGKIVAKAEKRSILRSAFDITFGSVTCELSKKGFFGKAFELQLNGSVIGRIERESIWKRSVRADLPEDWPDPLKVFILWLGLLMWQREAAAASG